MERTAPHGLTACLFLISSPSICHLCLPNASPLHALQRVSDPRLLSVWIVLLPDFLHPDIFQNSCSHPSSNTLSAGHPTTGNSNPPTPTPLLSAPLHPVSFTSCCLAHPSTLSSVSLLSIVHQWKRISELTAVSPSLEGWPASTCGYSINTFLKGKKSVFHGTDLLKWMQCCCSQSETAPRFINISP